MVKCTIEQGALLKILGHAAKFPSSGVNGVLLGTAASPGDGGGGDVFVQDVIPLCHTSLALAPALETGLALAEAYAQQAGTSLVGYYHSDSRFIGAPADLTPVARRVADRVADHQPAAVVLLLDNKKLAAFTRGDVASPFDVFARDGARSWKRLIGTSSTAADAGGASGGGQPLELATGSWKVVREDFFSLFKAFRHRLLYDFEEHLDDIGKDFIGNEEWAKQAKFALPGQAL